MEKTGNLTSLNPEFCFNGENYLLKTLNSILIQKYQNFEVIFVDNCFESSFIADFAVDNILKRTGLGSP